MFDEVIVAVLVNKKQGAGVLDGTADGFYPA